MNDAARGVILVLVTSAVLMVIPEGLGLPPSRSNTEDPDHKDLPKS